MNRVAGQGAAAFGIGDAHAFGATDAQCGRLAANGRVVTGAGDVGDDNVG